MPVQSWGPSIGDQSALPAQVRMGHAPEMLAVLNNTVLGLFARQGQPMSLRPDAHSPIISTEHSLLSWLKEEIRLCNSPGA